MSFTNEQGKILPLAFTTLDYTKGKEYSTETKSPTKFIPNNKSNQATTPSKNHKSSQRIRHKSYQI
jgi:hypothetical protein